MEFGALTPFLEAHFPVLVYRPWFVLMIVGVSVLLFHAAARTRSRAAMVAGLANLAYLVPFVRL